MIVADQSFVRLLFKPMSQKSLWEINICTARAASFSAYSPILKHLFTFMFIPWEFAITKKKRTPGFIPKSSY